MISSSDHVDEREDEVGEEKREGDALNYVFARMAAMEAELQSLRAQKKPDVGVPPVPRNQRRHIRVWVNPYNQVRREVPDDYDGPEEVKGFINHDNTRLFSGR